MEWLIVIITALALFVAYMYFDLRDTQEDLDMAIEAMLELQTKHNKGIELSEDLYEKLFIVNSEQLNIKGKVDSEKFEHFMDNYEFYKKLLEESENVGQ